MLGDVSIGGDGVRGTGEGPVRCRTPETHGDTPMKQYMLSVHHQPRSEDWSAMPVDWCGFKIMPRDFLDKSPVQAK